MNEKDIRTAVGITLLSAGAGVLLGKRKEQLLKLAEAAKARFVTPTTVPTSAEEVKNV